MKKKFSIIIILLFCIIGILMSSYYSKHSSATSVIQIKPPVADASKNNINQDREASEKLNNKPETEVNIKQTVSEVSLISVGDIMFHMPQVTASKEGNSYNFKPLFSEVKDVISSKDIAVGNLETTINPKRALSGYPTFNSPVQVLDALKDTGFDVLLTNNNHILDTGIEGVRSTNKLVKEYGLKSIGSAEKDEYKSIIVEKNNIKIGMLAYTYGTNFGSSYKEMINYIDKQKLKNDIEEIKGRCDFIIVYLHIGTEYVRTVEPYQADIVKVAAESGANAILCSHPHVSKKSELLNFNGKEVYVNYSMGNFISNQNTKYTDIGSMTNLIIEKSGSQTKLKAAETIPVYRLRYKIGSKTIYKTVLQDSITKYKSLISQTTLDYINQVSSQLIFKYTYSEAQFVNNN